MQPKAEADLGSGGGGAVVFTASLPPSSRGEALRLHVGRLWLEVRTLRRTDPPLPEAHWTAPLPVPALPARFFALRSPGLAHETSSLSPAPTLGPSWGLRMEQEWTPSGWFSLGWTLSQIRGPTDPLKLDQGLAHRQPPTKAPTRRQPQGATQRHPMVTQTQPDKPPNKWTQLDTELDTHFTLTLWTKRQTLRELDP